MLRLNRSCNLSVESLLSLSLRTKMLRQEVISSVWFLEQYATGVFRKVVSPLARSYCNRPILDVMKSAEKEKCREYRERIVGVEHADFNPLVFTVSCAIGPQSAMVLKRIAEKLCVKQIFRAPWLPDGCAVASVLRFFARLCSVFEERERTEQTRSKTMSHSRRVWAKLIINFPSLCLSFFYSVVFISLLV